MKAENQHDEAFPSQKPQKASAGDGNGMTLREYFCARALPAVINHPHFKDSDAQEIAGFAIKIADAALYELDQTKFA